MDSVRSIDTLKTDILILGTGGAGLFAALHARQEHPDASIAIVAKGLFGKSGCTRMVQGGYNVAMNPGDSIERHFMDSIVGGKWLPRQDLVWTLCEKAVERIRELENELGCFFDRNPDGTLHQKAFAGQSFDRTAHRGDLTGIEIINRLMERVWTLDVQKLEEHRAIELVPARDRSGIAAVLCIDIRTGRYRLIRARAVLLATGAGPTMYKYHTPSGDKTCDGLAMGLRYGLPLRDLEMIQFHPTGVLAGPHTRMTGTILEEGLRGAGGYLLNGGGERFMERYHPSAERATRDIVSRSMFNEIQSGRVSPQGGLFIEMAHLGPENVRRKFPGMVKRCADCGFDLAAGRVEVVPTAHYMMGGIEMEVDGSTASPGLYVAGEDAGGVHGANRLGGNGVANSTVFGGIAGEAMARYVASGAPFRDPDSEWIEQGLDRAELPFGKSTEQLASLRDKLLHDMWDHVGIVRTGSGIRAGIDSLDGFTGELSTIGLPDRDRAFNLSWQDCLNLYNLVEVSRAIAMAALAREDSRGAHFRADFPETGDLDSSSYTRVCRRDGGLALDMASVQFTIVSPGESLIDSEAGVPPSG
ncbi:MAG: FAD-dependent oxidoreductase [Gammaproteobacteria bacterium]|nr:FAD-dependent oxidoreductase [Gammaproteobacteria bacterium]MYD75189.1 FAD-dependent oxidoreductase [Gammaproteobacteria bacterium]MYJ51586.1 FAD-dependent oxidoreductase [Gammaproteobacteria bacterium]